MTVSDYNPFSQTIEGFPPEELANLRGVTEGWVVDYKVQGLPPKKFGKHIAAFANQFGGWLFVGVQESPASPYVAHAFPGIDEAEVGAVVDAIRDGASRHVSPPVFFERRVIEGPVPEIDLADGRCIVVVHVPAGNSPPFIHSDGRIYRRQDDSSEPVPETDRTALDIMLRRSQDAEARLRSFVIGPTEGLSGIHALPHCYAYFIQDLSLTATHSLSLEAFQKAMTKNRHTDGLWLALNDVFPTQDGFIARHLPSSADPLGDDLYSLRWWGHGSVRLTIPIGLVDHSRALEKDELFQEFVEDMGHRSGSYSNILDLNRWLASFIMLTGVYLNLSDSLGLKRPVWGKVVFRDMHSSVPYIGMPSYLAQVAKTGVPVCQDDVVQCPGSSDVDFLRLWDGIAQLKHPWQLIALLVASTLRSVGVEFNAADKQTLSHEFTNVWERGAKN